MTEYQHTSNFILKEGVKKMGFLHLLIFWSIRMSDLRIHLWERNNGKQEGKWHIPKPVESRFIL